MTKKKYVFGGVCIAAVCACIGIGVFQMQRQQSEDLLGEGVIFIDEHMQDVPLGDALPEDEQYTILAEVLVTVPQSILDKMYADGWGIAITEESLSEKYYKGIYSSVMAVTDSRIKTIWIANTERAIRNATIHEIGHYIEYSKGYPNRSQEFQAIYLAEKDKFVVVDGSARQARSSDLEYFAEAFQETLLHPDSMLENTPMTYQYMINLINSYE